MKSKLIVATAVMLVSAALALPQAKYPPETRNAALRYWMAFAEMRDPPSDETTQDVLTKISNGEAPWDETKVGPILDANGEAIRTLQRAVKLPECDWGIEYSRGVRAAIPYVPRARVMARLNQLQGMREMAKGDSQAAVNTWLAGVKFSQDLARGGTLIFALVAKSALLPNLRVLMSEARKGHLTEPQKQQVLTVLEGGREGGFDWAAAWRLETVTLAQFFAELRNAANPRELYLAVAGEKMPEAAGVPSSEDIRRFRQYMEDVQKALQLPPDVAKSRLQALNRQKRLLAEVIQPLIPSAEKVNASRSEVAAARKELLEDLVHK